MTTIEIIRLLVDSLTISLILISFGYMVKNLKNGHGGNSEK